VRSLSLLVVVVLSLPVLGGPLTGDLCQNGPCCSMPPAMAADCCTIDEAPPEQPETVLTSLLTPLRVAETALHDETERVTSTGSVRSLVVVPILAPLARERLALLSTYLI
jgi:hypothetical protein